jgi:DNA polymerase bacteriophage-type
MKLTPVFLDFESYWNTDHTLSKMSPLEYVMSPKTEIISMSIKIKDGPTEVYFGERDIRKALGAVGWSDKLAVGHNMSGFDALILKWRFGIQPAMWGCTAAMARPRYAKTCGVSLAKLVQELGVGEKKDAVLHNTKGKYLKDFTPEELDAMRVYNREDTEQCAALFHKLVKGFPRDELILIHLTTQMLVNPQFFVDVPLVETALSIERDQKRKALLELAKMLRSGSLAEVDWADDEAVAEFVRSEMASAARFAKLLESRAVSVPMKASPTNPLKEVPALAKTDEAFLALQDHPDTVVATAARVRLSVKSTLLETRLQAFLAAAANCRGRLPVPLKYCGADTSGRWSGEQYNCQNLPRVGGKPKTSDALRMSLKAPPGHSIVVADLSGIELRVNHFLWKVEESMDLYRQDAEADLYRAFAAARYGITPSDVSKDQRQLAKVAQLGLGFGAGAATFRKVAKLMGGLELSAEEAQEVVDSWRATYYRIVDGWKTCHAALPHIRQGTATALDPWGLCEVEHEAIRLPSGRRIHYPGLRQERNEDGKSEWWYAHGRHKARIYAGKIDENIVQALARDVIAGNVVDLYKRTGLEPALLVHDEIVLVVPTPDAKGVLDELQGLMRTPPKWWPELITWSEGDIAGSYGAAK